MSGDQLHNLILVLQIIGMIATSAIAIVEFIIKQALDRQLQRIRECEDRLTALLDRLA